MIKDSRHSSRIENDTKNNDKNKEVSLQETNINIAKEMELNKNCKDKSESKNYIEN